MSQNYQKSLFILFVSLLAGQTIMLTVLYFFVAPPDPALNARSPLSNIYPVLLLAPVAGSFIAKRRIAAAREQTTLADKLMTYRSALVLRWATCELAVITLAIFYFFILGQLPVLALSLLALGYFMALFPSRDKMINDLELSAAEQTEV